MIIRELYDMCKDNMSKNVVMFFNGESIPICQRYIEDGINYYFRDTRMYNGEQIMYYIEAEAEDECWHDIHNGSSFFNCNIVFVDSNVDSIDNIPSDKFFDVVNVKVVDNEIRMMCEAEENKIKYFEDCFATVDNDYTTLLDIVNLPKNKTILQYNDEEIKILDNLSKECHGLGNLLSICKLFDEFCIENEDELDSWFDDLNEMNAYDIVSKYTSKDIIADREAREDFEDFIIGQGKYGKAHWFTDKDFEKSILLYLIDKDYFPEKE